MYRIRIAFFCDNDPDLMPAVLAACDEYTEDAWGGTPDFFEDAMKTDPGRTRELIITIPEAAVRRLFEVPTVSAQFDGSECES